MRQSKVVGVIAFLVLRVAFGSDKRSFPRPGLNPAATIVKAS
jgi:hypothetical protein